MQKLTDQGSQKINDLAQRYGVSTDAVMALLQALINGHGTMAQFNHHELGGSGQWSQGGMTMIGDMFNNVLKAKVDGLCTEISRLLAQQPFAPPPWVASRSRRGRQQQQQADSGSPGMVGGSPAVSLFVPAAQGVPATGGRRTWVSRAGAVPRTTFATPTSPTRGGWPWRSMGT